MAKTIMIKFKLLAFMLVLINGVEACEPVGNVSLWFWHSGFQIVEKIQYPIEHKNKEKKLEMSIFV